MKKEKIGFYYFTAISLICMSLNLSGCATASRSLGLGGAIGAGTGAILGGIANPGKNGEYRTRNIVVGSAVGGMAGMMTGALVHEHTEKEKREAFLKGQASAPPPKVGVMPTLQPAKVKTEWIEGRKVGNRWIDGHYEYVIEEPAQWAN